MIKDINVQNEAVNVSDFREGKQVKISPQHNDKSFWRDNVDNAGLRQVVRPLLGWLYSLATVSEVTNLNDNVGTAKHVQL